MKKFLKDFLNAFVSVLQLIIAAIGLILFVFITVVFFFGPILLAIAFNGWWLTLALVTWPIIYLIIDKLEWFNS
jgi:hypothetical protein